MKTDYNLYLICKAKPDILHTIAGFDAQNASFDAITVKDVRRELDGVLRPDDQTQPQTIIEFQGYFDKDIYQRMILEMMLLYFQDQRNTYGVIIFLSPQHDPKTDPWYAVSTSSAPDLEVVYLNQVLRDYFGDHLDALARTQPELAVFAPIYLSDDALKRNAAKAYRILEQAPMPQEQREVFKKVFINWLYERFTELPEEEIRAMIELRTPLHETRAYQDIIKAATLKVIQKHNPQLLKDAAPKIIEDAAPKIIEDAAPKIIEDAAPKIIEDAAPKIIKDAAPDHKKQILQELLDDNVISQDEFDRRVSRLNGNHSK